MQAKFQRYIDANCNGYGKSVHCNVVDVPGDGHFPRCLSLDRFS